MTQKKRTASRSGIPPERFSLSEASQVGQHSLSRAARSFMSSKPGCTSWEYNRLPERALTNNLAVDTFSAGLNPDKQAQQGRESGAVVVSLPERLYHYSPERKEDLQSVPFTKAVDLFIVDRSPRWRSKKTRATRIHVLGIFSRIAGGKSVENLTPFDVLQMKAAVSEGNGNAWVNLCRSIWVSFLFRMADLGALSFEKLRSLAPAWEALPEDEEPQRAKMHLSEAEEDRLCECLQHRPAVIRYVRLAVLFGFRYSTMEALCWEWVSDDWVLRIPGKFLKNRKGLVYPVPKRAQEILGERGAPEDKLLQGLPAHCTRLNGLLKTAAKRAGIKGWRGMSTHQFRRTWCLRFKASGGTREQAMELQNWHEMNVLVRSYWPSMEVEERRLLVERAFQGR